MVSLGALEQQQGNPGGARRWYAKAIGTGDRTPLHEPHAAAVPSRGTWYSVSTSAAGTA